MNGASLPLIALPTVPGLEAAEIEGVYEDVTAQRAKGKRPWLVIEYENNRSLAVNVRFFKFPDTRIVAVPTDNFIFTLKIGYYSYLRFRYTLEFGREYQEAWDNGNNEQMMAASMVNWRGLLDAIEVEMLQENKYGRVNFSNDIAASLARSSYAELEQQMRVKMTGKVAYNDTRKKFLIAQPGAIKIFAWAAVKQAFARCGKRLGAYRAPPSAYAVPYVPITET